MGEGREEGEGRLAAAFWAVRARGGRPLGFFSCIGGPTDKNQSTKQTTLVSMEPIDIDNLHRHIRTTVRVPDRPVGSYFYVTLPEEVVEGLCILFCSTVPNPPNASSYKTEKEN